MTKNNEPRITSECVMSSSSKEADERRAVNDHDVYFNSQFEAEPVYIGPGQVACSVNEDEMLVATVGAGVVVSIYDHELKMGALAYVVLPDVMLDCFPFLDTADRVVVDKAFEPIETCVGEMKRHGAGKTRIKIRLYGGLIGENDPDDRGLKNTVFVQEYLFRKGLQVYNADIGGPFIRRVHFFPSTGRAVRRVLKRQKDFEDMYDLEAGFNRNIINNS